MRDKPGFVLDADWQSQVVVQGKGSCRFAPRGSNQPWPTCPPPKQPIDRAKAASLGWRFAPIVYQHPNDPSWLTDPAKWFAEARIYNTRAWKEVAVDNPDWALHAVIENNSTMEYLSTSNWVATRLVEPITVEDDPDNPDEPKAGFSQFSGAFLRQQAIMDPVVDNTLTGKVWFTAFRPFNDSDGAVIPHAYAYSYGLYYPWNGCSNQMLATQAGGRHQGIEYVMCPDGSHEGDLETVKVWVCEADMLNDDPSSAVQMVQYSAHGWRYQYDCRDANGTALTPSVSGGGGGECTFEVDKYGVRRLVTIAALNSHANYPVETGLLVYAMVDLQLLVNMEALYLADRHKRGPSFHPNASNTRFLPYLDEMTLEQATGELHWATFPGVWGATIVPTNSSRTVGCLYDNLTRVGPCDYRNPAAWALALFIDPVGYQYEDLTWTATSSGNTVSGPLWRRYGYINWEKTGQAPLWAGVVPDRLSPDEHLCPFEAPIVTTAVPHPDGFGNISISHFINVIIGLVLASSMTAFAMVLPILLAGNESSKVSAATAAAEAAMAAAASPGAPGGTGGGGKDAADAPKPESEPPTAAAAGSESSVGMPMPAPTPASIDRAGSNGAAPAVAAAVAPAGNGSSMPPPANRPTSQSRMAAARQANQQLAEAATAAVMALNMPRGKSGSGAMQGGAAGALLEEQAAAAANDQMLRMWTEAITDAMVALTMQPYMLFTWIAIGTCMYVAGIVLGAIGVDKVVNALNAVLPLSFWETLRNGVIAAYVIFGALQLAIVIASLWIRPTFKLLCGWCGWPDSCLSRISGGIKSTWRAHAVLTGLLVICMHVTLLLFGLGLTLWVIRYGVNQVCLVGIAKLFGSAYELVLNLCIDLSSIGIDQVICGNQLANMCGLWSDMRADYLVYSGLLLLTAQSMFVVLGTTNYTGMRASYTIKAVMASEEKQLREKLRMQQQHDSSSEKTPPPAGKAV